MLSSNTRAVPALVYSLICSCLAFSPATHSSRTPDAVETWHATSPRRDNVASLPAAGTREPKMLTISVGGSRTPGGADPSASHRRYAKLPTSLPVRPRDRVALVFPFLLP